MSAVAGSAAPPPAGHKGVIHSRRGERGAAGLAFWEEWVLDGAMESRGGPDRRLLDLLAAADEAGRVAQTRHLCEGLLRRWPDHGPTLLRHAATLTSMCLYEEAAAVLHHAGKVVPERRLHLVHVHRGHLLAAQGRHAEAEAAHLEAHELDPEDATYLIYAGSAALHGGDVERAAEHLERALCCPEGCLDEAWFNLGGCRLVRKRFAEARECYLRALEIDPEYAVAKEKLEDLERVMAMPPLP